MNNRSITVLQLLIFCIVSSGCLYSRELSRTAKDIERHSAAELDRYFTINVGSVTVGLARTILKFVDDDDVHFARHLLADVRKLKLGLFEVDRDPVSDFDLPSLKRFEGWEVGLLVRDNSDNVYLMYKERDDSISEIFLFVFEDDHLMIARASGNLTRIVTEIIREYESEIAEIG